MLILNDADQRQLDSKGITSEDIRQQLTIFQNGIPFTALDRACTIGDGITKLNDADIKHYAQLFQKSIDSGRVTKFVPASGAASRMFKSLLSALDLPTSQEAQISFQAMLSQSNDPATLEQFFEKLNSFPFFDELSRQLANEGIHPSKGHYKESWSTLLKQLLHSPGLNYASLPKGLLKFHRYSEYVRTPFEEQVYEGIAYARDANGIVRIHFTVSPEPEKLIQSHLENLLGQMENCDFQLDLSFSHQAPSTDTIAVEKNNVPFRDSNGRLVFRPGGHGALLNNLNHLKGDIVFIKNIDNVVPTHLVDQPNLYKKALGGYLIGVQQQLFAYLEMFSKNHIRLDDLEQISDFANSTLGLSIPPTIKRQSVEKQQQFWIDQLHRPLRVCGMVPNTGEPGGGPFWITHEDGTYSRQIVESSQVNPQSPTQQSILHTSTHFNPVDLVCAVRDFQGHTFDLPQFSDPKTGFISMKSYQGRELKALELPGLWNGAMAFWNTIFVEVPASTFNPVKTVMDLLRPEHQPG